jgi:hypothetical protein
MCTVCGCGSGEVKIGGALPRRGQRPATGATRGWKPAGEHTHEHQHPDGTTHSHAHDHPHDHDHSVQADTAHILASSGQMHFGAGAAHAHAPGLSQSQMVRIEQDILGKNDGYAAANRRWLAERSLLLIENVGNLVCPAAFDLGEAHKVAILSVTEGEDKPLKYPDMFAAADLMLLNKIDLLPHLNFDVERAIGYAKRVNPRLRIIQVSATSGAGMAEWLDWIERGMAAAHG